MSSRLHDWCRQWLITADEAKTRASRVFGVSSTSNEPAPLRLDGLEPRILFSATPVDPAMMPDADHSAMVVEVSPESTPSESDAASIATLAQQPPADQSLHEIVIIDSAVPDLEQLLDDLGTSGRDAEVFVLDADRDGIDQITEILDSRAGIDSLHLVSHAEDGAVKLGNTWLGDSNLDGYAGQIASWHDSLSTDADILFYGCDLASDLSGRTLVDSIGALTGADVAASTDGTGHADYGADWDLEYSRGAVESNVAFSSALQQNWQSKLATITVNTFADVIDGADGVTSLREAIIQTNGGAGGDTIVLGAGTYTLTITGSNEDAAASGDLDLLTNVTITGADAATTIIDASGLGVSDRVLDVLGSNLTMTGVTVTGGAGVTNGGGIRIDATSTVTLNEVIVTSNDASNGAGIHNAGVITMTDAVISDNGLSAISGGGLFNSGQATLDRVTISGNTASSGGGLYQAISATGNLSLTNVTVSGNTATSSGGGLYARESVTIVNSTIVLNQANTGGGILKTGGMHTVDLKNTLIAVNSVTSASPDVQGDLVSSGNNLIGDGTGMTGLTDGMDGNQVGTAGSPIDPMIDPVLANNGGFSATHALFAASPAIDAGTNSGSTPSTDQRGVTRDSPPDIGAYEYVGGAPTANSDSYSVNQDTTLTTTALDGLLVNDSDPEMDPLSAYIQGGPTNGILGIAPTGLINETRLTNDLGSDQQAVFSPDGSKIAFKSDRTGFNEIYTMDADGSDVTQLTFDSATAGLPSWSPDGTQLVFHTNRDGNDEIYRINADGTGLTRLTNNTFGDTQASWSPDGTQIAFRSDRAGNHEIYVMNADGTNQTRLTNDAAADNNPAWSPDGSKIVFTSERDGNFNIYTMNADGTNQTFVTTDVGDDRSPRFSPDGSRIVFHSDRDGDNEIFVINADGTGELQLTDNAFIDAAPHWSPDGTKVLFGSDRDGNHEIYVADLLFDGTFDYIPDAGWFGNDAFYYVAHDGINDSNIETVAITVNPANDPPVADAGGPYSINEGEDLVLDASGSSDSNGDTLSYSWDIDGDGQFDDATGVNPTVSWANLAGMSIPINDDGSYTVAVRVDDGNLGVTTDSVALTVNNVAPTLSTTGSGTASTAVAYTLNLSANDPGNDTITSWTINWGDGTIETIAGNPSSVTHTYSGSGFTYNILASATDEDGAYMQNELVVASGANDRLLRYGPDGSFLQAFATSDGSDYPVDVIVGPDGNLYMSGWNSDDVLRYDAATGAFIDTFVSVGSGGLNSAAGLAFGPDGNLYVASRLTSEVLRYDGSTGAFIDAFVTVGSGGLNQAEGLTFGPDGSLYVSDYANSAVYKYDGDTGAFQTVFVTSGSGGLDLGEDLAFGPDGNLYVASDNGSSVLRYNGTTGAFIDAFVTSGSGGLSAATGLEFGPDGNLYVGSWSTDSVLRFDGTTGAFIDEFITAGSGGLSATDYFSFIPGHQVAVAASNPPSVSATPGALVYAEDSGKQKLDAGITVTDADGTLESATIQIVMNHTATEDLLHFTNQNGITGSYNATTGVLALTGTASVADYETALRSIEYENTSLNPNESTRMVSISVNDGTSSAGTSRNININAVGPLAVDTTSDVADGDTSSISALTTNKGADGKVSLREAILAANATIGQDTIEFEIRDALVGGAHTIVVSAAGLPDITDSVIIDGSTDDDFGSTPIIELDGSAFLGDGLRLVAGSDNSVIRSLVVNRFGANGIEVLGSNGTKIVSNYIGTDVTGTVDLGNGNDGIHVRDAANTTIGGAIGSEGNLLSGNQDDGIGVNNSTGTIIQGNLIGTDATGTLALGNTDEGITIRNGSTGTVVGGSAPQERNIISGNLDSGVRLADASVSNNTILGNYIGTDINGNLDLGNAANGILVEMGATGVTIGGTGTDDGNLISGNDLDGIQVLNGSFVTVEGNHIGTTVAGTADLGNSRDGIRINNSSSVQIGGTLADARNLISDNDNHGIHLLGGSSGNTIEGNFIGTNAAGTGALGNAADGIHVAGGSFSNTIGGTTPDAGNLISGNGDDGIILYNVGTSNNGVYGNLIGTDVTGTAALGNFDLGIGIRGGASDNEIGGTGLNEANTIAFNGTSGVAVYDDAAGTARNRISGNSIHGHAGIGIDLVAGNNDRQTATINSATTDGGSLTVIGSYADAGLGIDTLTIEYFKNATNVQQGKTYLGQDTVITDASGNATFSHVITASVTAGQYITATVTDSTGNTSEFSLTLQAIAPAAPVVDNLIPDQVATEDAPFSFQFAANTFSDPNGDELTYTATLDDASPLPSWLSFDPSTRTFSGTPVNSDVGSLTVRVTADDGSTGSVFDDFTLTVVGGVNTVAPPTGNTIENNDLVFSVTNANAITVDDGTPSDPVLRTTLQVTNGTLNLATTAGLTSVAGDGTSVVTVIGVESAINTALDGLTYSPTFNYTGPANLQITTDLQADLLGYYQFTQAIPLGTDSSPAGANDGTPSGPGAMPDPYATFDGDRNSDVLVLDGVDDNIQIAGRFGTPSNLTLAAWVNIDAVNNQEVISVGGSIALRLNDVNNGAGVTGFYHDGIGWNHTDSNQFIGGDGWHHVALTHDDANNTQVIYIDGVALGTTSHAGSINWAHQPNTTIGSHANGSSYWLSGMLDDVRIYDRALSVGEIQALATDQFSDSESVSITVDPVNSPPTVANAIPDQNATEDSPFSFQFASNTFDDADGDTLTYSALQSDSSPLPSWLSFDAATRTFSGTPADADVGSITIRVTATDPSAASVFDDFVLTIVNVNDAPTLDNSGNLTLDTIDKDLPAAMNNGNSVAEILASGGGTPIADVDGNLTGIAIVSVDDSDGMWEFSTNGGVNWNTIDPDGAGVTLINGNNALLLESDAGHQNRIRFNPGVGYTGSAGDISFRAWDGTELPSVGNGGYIDVASIGTGDDKPFSSATEKATLWVNAPPTISDIDHQAIMVNRPTDALSFNVGDAEDGSTPLMVTASSSNTTLVPNANITITGTGGTRQVTVTPASDQIGTTTITLTVSDTHGATTQTSFKVFVAPHSVTVTTTSDVVDAANLSSIAHLLADSGDDNVISLREAIIAANNTVNAADPDEVILNAGTYTLGGTKLDINDSVIIEGDAANNTLIDGNGLSQVFKIAGTSRTSIHGVTIQNGVDAKGAIEVGGDATLSLLDSTLRDNTGDHGGALHVNGTLNLNRVSLLNNTAKRGGAIYLHNSNAATLTNVTISGNQATERGGAIWSNVSATIINATIAYNEAANSGAALYGEAVADIFTLQNTILAENHLGDGTHQNVDVDTTINSLGNNIDSDGTAGIAAAGDVSGIPTADLEVGLMALAYNGGTTMTHALAADSIAIDAGNTSGAPVVDQRGTARPLDGNGDAIADVDIGAFESDNSSASGAPVITGTAKEDQTLTADTSGISDPDGIGTMNFQWLRNGTVISGATGNTYTLGDADVGTNISVKVTYIDGGGTRETLTSSQVGPVANVNDAPVGVVNIAGIVTEGETLTAIKAFTDDDGVGVISYQWKRDGVAITGATSQTYTLTDADVGAVITAIASYADNHGTGESVSSLPTAPVAERPFVPPPPPPPPIDPGGDGDPPPPPPEEPPPDEEPSEEEETEETPTTESGPTVPVPPNPTETPEPELEGDSEEETETPTAVVVNVAAAGGEQGEDADGNAAKASAGTSNQRPSRATTEELIASGAHSEYVMMSRPGVMWNELDEHMKHVDSHVHGDLIVVGAAGAAASSFTVGAVAWALRTGFLASGLLAQMPAWRTVDPMLIMQSLGGGSDSETLEELMAHQSQELDD